MRVPDEAGIGEAKITLSFPRWKEARLAFSDLKESNVTPATFEVLIDEPNVKGHPLQIKPAPKPINGNAP